MLPTVHNKTPMLASTNVSQLADTTFHNVDENALATDSTENVETVVAATTATTTNVAIAQHKNDVSNIEKAKLNSINVVSSNNPNETLTTPTTTSSQQQQQQKQQPQHEQQKQQHKERPTTPIAINKFNTKQRPTNLTLNILPPATPTTTSRRTDSSCSNYIETDNLTLSNQNSSNSASTSGSIFPHEQYKTIKKLDIAFTNVSYTTKVGFFKREYKDILIGPTGHFRAGELSAIIGPSGAGKSTMLNILSGYTAYGYTGDFLINGKERDLKVFKPNVAFITQNTSLQPFLTVKEAMHFSANLKVGTHMPQSAKKERVRKILEAIGMYENRHTRTGKLSGGQRKRLAIALELVNNPPVLVLDEPTTGLDSSSSTQLITLLKKLALEGRTVICTIHQPSALTFQLFDHLYAIAEGQCIYAGGVENLVPFLAECGLHCPESYNPADYLMEIATHDYGKQNDKLVALSQNGRNHDYRQTKTARETQLAALRKVDNMMSAGLLTPVTAPVLSTPLPTNARFGLLNAAQTTQHNQQHQQQQQQPPHKPLTPIKEMSSKVWDSNDIFGAGNDDATISCCKSKKQNKPKSPVVPLDPSNLCKRENIYATPFYRQLSILLLRTFLILWRDNSLTTLRFFVHFGIGLLIGFIFYDIGNDAGNAMNNFRYTFYTIMFIMYCAFSGILVKFPLEFPIVSREHFNRWYSLRAYYVAITLADIPIQIICTSLFIFPTYYLTGQPMEFKRVALFFGIVFMTALVAQSIGLAVGAALSIQLGAILGPFFICPFLQFSGFFLQERHAPTYLRWMFDISFLKYSLDGAMLAIFGYERERLECNDTYCHYSRPKSLLKDLDMTNANYEFAIIFMFVLFIILRILAFYIMSFRLRLFR